MTTEAIVPDPATPDLGFTAAAFEHMLTVGGLQLPGHRIAQAVEGFRQMAGGLGALRSIPLPFLTDVPEPAAANRWIEQGGTR